MDTKPHLVLVHGWNHNHYTGSGCHPYWNDKAQFVEELEKHFHVWQPHLPGFCGTHEPDSPFEIADFARYLEGYIMSNHIDPVAILGWSFGGAVAATWKKQFGKTTPVILVSPALARAYREKNIVGTAIAKLLPEWIVAPLRTFYLVHIVKNPYFTTATPVMRETYRKIVGQNTVGIAREFPSNEVMFVFGGRDSATPPDLFLKQFGSTPKHFKVFENASHDIAATDAVALAHEVIQFTQQNQKH